MLGPFPKLFDKNFAIGFLLPAILGLVALAWLFPSLGLLSPLRAMGANETTLGGLTYLVLLVYGAAILLIVTNTLQYQFLEGYLAPLAGWKGLRDRHEEKRSAIVAEHKELRARRKTEKQAFPRADMERLKLLKKQLVNDYPPPTQAVMPTRFGNVIRAFESYPFQVYGADGVPIWLRLAAVVPKEFAAELQDVRAQVNFLLNLLYLLPLVATAGLLKAIADTPWAAINAGDLTGAHIHPAAIVALAAVLLVPLVYGLAVGRAKAWGDVVKAAFDCYLPALTTQLGYEVPASDAARRAFWGEINALIIYRQPMNAEHYRIAAVPPPAGPATHAPEQQKPEEE